MTYIEIFRVMPARMQGDEPPQDLKNRIYFAVVSMRENHDGFAQGLLAKDHWSVTDLFRGREYAEYLVTVQFNMLNQKLAHAQQRHVLLAPNATLAVHDECRALLNQAMSFSRANDPSQSARVEEIKRRVWAAAAIKRTIDVYCDLPYGYKV